MKFNTLLRFALLGFWVLPGIAFATGDNGILTTTYLQGAHPETHTDTDNINSHIPHTDTAMPLISITTDSSLDMNMSAALEFSDPTLRPPAITLPVLANSPLDMLEIKFRVLNLQF